MIQSEKIRGYQRQVIASTYSHYGYKDYLLESASFQETALDKLDLKSIIREQVGIHEKYKKFAGVVLKVSKMFFSDKEARKKFYSLVNEKIEQKRSILGKKNKTPEEALEARKILSKAIGQSLQVAFSGLVFAVPKIPGTFPIVLMFLDAVVKHASFGKLGIIPQGFYRIIQTVAEDEKKEDKNDLA
jgi:hypothetical protein